MYLVVEKISYTSHYLNITMRLANALQKKKKKKKKKKKSRASHENVKQYIYKLWE